MRYGGVPTSVRELCRGLSLAGLQVTLCSTTRGYNRTVDEPADRFLISAGVDVRYFPYAQWPPVEKYLYSPSLASFLEREIRSVQILHLHTLWQHPILAAARISRKAGVPYLISPCGVLDRYGFRIHPLFKRVYGWLVEKRTLMSAACLHFTSERERQQAYLFGTTLPLRIIPRGIRTEEIPPVPAGNFRKLYPEIGDRHILLFLSRLHPKKRLDIVAQAFVLLAKRREDVHLVIAGPDDGVRGQAEAILMRGGVLHRSTIPGLLTGETKWAALRDAAVFLLPSEDENFGVSVLEAMACGTPVLVSDGVALADTIRNTEAGVVLEKDASRWAQTIGELLDDPPRRHRMGQAGRSLAKERFSSTRLVAEMLGLYEEILSGRMAWSG
ncbi:MAG: glycosyltransferase [Candidatus Omnitrophica bacterium]|nr:glycosyltransferase [Candidatus Omnitrophota bacterium]